MVSIRRQTAGLGIVAVCLAVTLGAQSSKPAPTSVVPEQLSGYDTFQFYCAPCHGRDGHGDGPAASALRMPPTDLSLLSEHNGGKFPSDKVAAAIRGRDPLPPAHGSLSMPVWGPVFKGLDMSGTRADSRFANLVAHLATLQRKAPDPSKAPTPAATTDGRLLFKTYCASCHGVNGLGDGPAAGALKHIPPSLLGYASRNGGVFPAERLARIIDGQDVTAHGNREMPVWGDAFRAAEGLTPELVKGRITAILKFLESIQARNGL